MHKNTIFGQMLQMFSRHEFEKAVKETGAEYHARGFKSREHFAAMPFGQMAGQDSLRGIETGLAAAQNLYHLGVKPIHRATLAYADEHRSHELFKKLLFSCCLNVNPLLPGINSASRIHSAALMLLLFHSLSLI